MGLFDRPTGDIVVLLLLATACTAVLFTGAGIFIIAFVHPERDLRLPEALLGSVSSTMVGSAVGYLAGKHARNNGGG